MCQNCQDCGLHFSGSTLNLCYRCRTQLWKGEHGTLSGLVRAGAHARALKNTLAENWDRARTTGTKPSSQQQTLHLFREGLSPSKIAGCRGQKLKTIYHHLASLLQEGRLQLHELATKSQIRDITEAYRCCPRPSTAEAVSQCLRSQLPVELVGLVLHYKKLPLTTDRRFLEMEREPATSVVRRALQEIGKDHDTYSLTRLFQGLLKPRKRSADAKFFGIFHRIDREELISLIRQASRCPSQRDKAA